MTEGLEGRTVGEILDDPQFGPQERSAARATINAVELLQEALASSGLSQRHLAQALEVSEGRVSQVLKGDGNIYVTTLARYLRAMGYELALVATPAEETRPEIGKRRVRNSANTRPSEGVVRRKVTNDNAADLAEVR